MASLTAAQAQSLVDQALQTGDVWQHGLPSFLTAQTAANLAALQNVLAPLAGKLNGPQQYALVSAVSVIKGWTGATPTDGVKLSQIAAGVATLMAAEATANALPNGGNTIGEGGRFVAALTTLT